MTTILRVCCWLCLGLAVSIAFAGVSQDHRKDRAKRTLMILADYSSDKADRVMQAVTEKRGHESLGATFVRDAYVNQTHGLDTCECKIIWKAILVTCRSNQDGFEIMEVATPWLDENEPPVQ